MTGLAPQFVVLAASACNSVLEALQGVSGAAQCVVDQCTTFEQYQAFMRKMAQKYNALLTYTGKYTHGFFLSIYSYHFVF